jgi:hypothetical protein
MIAQMVEHTQDTLIPQNLKSDRLTGSELKKFKTVVASYPTREGAAISLGIGNRGTLTRICAAGSGSPENIEKIRTRLRS